MKTFLIFIISKVITKVCYYRYNHKLFSLIIFSKINALIYWFLEICHHHWPSWMGINSQKTRIKSYKICQVLSAVY